MPRRLREGPIQRPRKRPEGPDHRVSIGIIRESALCRLCRARHKRHTFAVHRLMSWYRQGADVQRLLPHLSVYLGHVHIRTTQVYLSMTPELLQEANLRFERYAGKEDVDA
jgi:integrase/recombinase XerD